MSDNDNRFNSEEKFEFVKKINIIDENIFNSGAYYEIPLYQRAYAWEDKEIGQLIEDINDIKVDDKTTVQPNYYIGTLIVSKQDNEEKYEVVDGQQRLTTLYLLFNYLGIETKPTLTFACREKSNYSLRNIKNVIDIINENIEAIKYKDDNNEFEHSIENGIKIIKDKFITNNINKKDFIKKLSKVVIFRIVVPKHTDLNRYFETMNVRGEQLEQHDILKAELMGYLNDNDEKERFAKIWDACSDMSGYIQMHLTDLRTAIFGESWDEIPSNNSLKDCKIEKKQIAKNNKDKKVKGELPETINDIIVRDFNIEDYDGVDDNDVRVRFESIIDFPYFLLHTLKLYIYLNSVKHKEQDKKIINELLDDKKLCDTFNNVIKNGKAADGWVISDNKEDFSRSFIVCLLRTRFLFDKYIIKREFAKDNVDGNWSLKSLKKQEGKPSKPYYVNTKFGEETLTKTNIMIQSALRVSYTSPRIMHWITDLLIWLSKENCQKINKYEMINYNKEAEHIAEKAVNDAFLGKSTDEIDSLGVKIPHIVFNYLDYLLWKNDKDKYKDFEFEFRNSVEHWYPQNPAEDKWEDVNTFGNLCIIQRNINSRFSNMAPEAKKSSYAKHIEKGSIKLRIMSDLTINKDGVNAKERWKSDVCKQHEKEMLKVLGFVDVNNKITLLNET